MILKKVKCGLRLGLPLIMGLTMITSLTTTAHADGEPVNLELGGEGATSWSIANIKPGDSGNKTVTLHNSGDKAGSVTIWISDIISSEGTNPESETGNTSEPGELDQHLTFDFSCNQLSTNLSLPVSLANLPQDASDPNYIKINPLNAGDTINLQWLWELPIQTGNEVNGDNLSFTIHYLLEELPSSPSGTSTPSEVPEDGDIDPTRLLQMNVLDKTTWLKMWTNGVIRQSYTIADSNDNLTLDINSGTKVTCGNDKVPTRIDLTVYEGTLPVPEDMIQIGPAYNSTTYIDGVINNPAQFEPPIRITLNFNPDDLPENTSSVFIVYYDEERGTIELEPLADSAVEAGTAEVELSHLELFGIAAKLAITHQAANFEASNLTISPTQPQVDHPVTISLLVTNNGSTIGSYTLNLIIDGTIWAVNEITLDPGSSETISFEASNLTEGEHQVWIAGLTSRFNINSPAPTPTQAIINWSLLGLIVVAAVIAALSASSLIKAKISRIQLPSQGVKHTSGS